MRAPPTWIALGVDQALPGFWYWFRAAMLRGFQGAPRGLTPTSWWRSVDFNAEVGGNERSQHLWGGAIDFAYGRVDHRIDPRALAAASTFRAQGFVVVPEADHLHVQTFPPR